MYNPNAPLCPHCGQLDAVRKASAIVNEGIATGQYESAVPVQWDGKTHVLPVKRTVVSKTQLAEKLACPSDGEISKWLDRHFPVPKLPATRFQGVVTMIISVALVGSFLVCAVSVFVASQAFPIIFGCYALSAALLIGFLIISGQMNKKNPKFQADYAAISSAKQLRAQKMSQVKWRWNELHYCFRCDGVFVLGENSFAPIEQMQGILFK